MNIAIDNPVFSFTFVFDYYGVETNLALNLYFFVFTAGFSFDRL